MHRTLLLGGGKIGCTIARFLATSGDYHVRVGDTDPAGLDRLRKTLGIETCALDVTRPDDLRAAMQDCQSVVSALPFNFNAGVAEAALAHGLSYFDLTEDIATAHRVRRCAERARPGQVFMPQCGLAPGFISILAWHLTQTFESLEAVRMRVGALPQFPTNSLNYNLTWSTDGLINEYLNPCQVIYDGRFLDAMPLDGLESFSLDGVRYEAFNTSGGLGTLCETLQGRVQELNYRTIRYPGHRDLMRFLLDELRLGRRPALLKEILEASVPITYQDVVVIFCTVVGRQDGQLVQLSDARKIYAQTLDGVPHSAIQITTAAGLCAVLDLHVAGRLSTSGFVRQEQVNFDEFIHNRFGRWYCGAGTTRYSRVTPNPQGDNDGDGEPSIHLASRAGCPGPS